MSTISNAKLLARIEAKGFATEQEINLFKNRLNRGAASWDEIDKLVDLCFRLTPEQTEKGYNWLVNLWKTPKGKERKNNPFGPREEAVLESFRCFTFDGFYNAGNGFVNFYVPIWGVVGEASGFQYYNDYKGIHIIG